MQLRNIYYYTIKKISYLFTIKNILQAFTFISDLKVIINRKTCLKDVPREHQPITATFSGEGILSGSLASPFICG